MSRLKGLLPFGFLVVANAALIAYALWGGLIDIGAPGQRLELGPARWIEAQAPGSDGFFRTDLFVAGSIRDGWLSFSAPGCAYSVLVNGHSIANEGYFYRDAAAVLDIGAYLQPGKNTIALHLQSGDYKTPVRLALAGGIRDAFGRVTPFVSDGRWFAASHDESRGLETAAWYAPEFQPATRAVPLGRPSPSELPRVYLPVEVFSTAAPTEWMATAGPRRQPVTFSNTFEVPPDATGVWVRLAGRDNFALVLNGQVLANDARAGDGLSIFDVTQYLRRGRNAIDVRVGSATASPRLSLDVLLATPQGTRVLLSGDGSWRLRDETRFQPRPRASEEERVVLLGEVRATRGAIVKSLVDLPQPVLFMVRRLARWVGFAALTLCVALLDWVCFGLVLSKARPGLGLVEAMRQDALLRSVFVLGLGVVVLLGYDNRFEPDLVFAPIFPLAAVGLLLLLRTPLLFVAAPPKTLPEKGKRGPHPWTRRLPGLATGLVLLTLLALGLETRLSYARSKPLDHDEVSIVMAAQKVAEQGYPTRSVGPLEKALTSYEAVPYPIAASLRLFGASEPAVRIPALIFSSLTLLLLFWAGASTWGATTGLLAAGVYALSPFSIYWGSNAFHPQQAQFFALLSTWAFYRAIEGPPATVRPWPLFGATLAFLGAYFSWEGTGLLFPAFLVALAVHNGHSMLWLKRGHLWLAAGMATFFVLGQQVSRILANVPYAVVGFGLSGQSFVLAFLDPLYDPTFYVEAFLFPAHHLLLSISLLLFLPRALRDRAMRYYLVVVVALLMMLTNLLPRTSSRYAFFVQGPFILAAMATLVAVGRGVWKAAAGRPRLVQASAGLFAVGLPVLVALSTNASFFKLERLGSFPSRITTMTPDYRGFDYRAAARVVKGGHRPGDIIVSLMPHAFGFYSEMTSDYYLQTQTNRQVFYNPVGSPHYMDRYVGTPVLRSLGELQDVLNRNRRVWILATPESAFQLGNDQATLDFIQKSARIVFESYSVRVYLWAH